MSATPLTREERDHIRTQLARGPGDVLLTRRQVFALLDAADDRDRLEVITLSLRALLDDHEETLA